MRIHLSISDFKFELTACHDHLSVHVDKRVGEEVEAGGAGRQKSAPPPVQRKKTLGTWGYILAQIDIHTHMD